MPRPATSARRLLLPTIGAMFLLALLPTKWSSWVSGLAGPVSAVITPAAAPFRMFGGWLRPGRGNSPIADDALAAAERERDRFELLWRQEQERTAELESLVRDLQGGRGLLLEVDATPIAAPIVSATSDLSSGVIVARAGRREGVTPNTVARVGGVHLVGRVIAVQARTSSILLLTDLRTQWVRGAVDTGAEAAAKCTLIPMGDGETLRGELDADATGVEVGQLVRLLDDEWPRSAQMLVLGRIVSMRPKEGAILRQEIIVRPERDLRRVSQVVLLTPGEATRGDDAGGEGAP